MQSLTDLPLCIDSSVVEALQVGLETYLRDGRAAVDAARSAAPECALFLDLKLHDIPATVSGAARAVADLAPDFLTVHASGGPAMVSAAAEALPDTRVVAVTVLTSLTTSDLRDLDLLGPQSSSAGDLAVRLAVAAVDAGADTLTATAHGRATGDGPVRIETTGVAPGGLAVATQHLDEGQVATAMVEARSLLQKNGLNADAQLLLIHQSDLRGESRVYRLTAVGISDPGRSFMQVRKPHMKNSVVAMDIAR